MANLRSLVSLIVYASMVMVQPITAKRLLTPAADDDESSKHFDAQEFKSLLCQHICPSPEPECPTEIVTSRSNLGVAIPDNGAVTPARVTLPVVLDAGCGCTIDNVAIAFGIDHTRVGDLVMELLSPDDGDVLLAVPPEDSDANLVAGNKITFDDSASGAKDPQTLGANVDGSDNILGGIYFAEGSEFGEVDPVNGLGLFNGTAVAEGDDWTFVVTDYVPGNAGTIQSVELTITCAE